MNMKKFEKMAMKKLKVSKDSFELVSKVKKMTTEQALEAMLSNPAFIDPVIYTLTAHDNGVKKSLSHFDYCQIMKKKARNSRNLKLIKEIQEVERLLL